MSKGKEGERYRMKISFFCSYYELKNSEIELSYVLSVTSCCSFYLSSNHEDLLDLKNFMIKSYSNLI